MAVDMVSGGTADGKMDQNVSVDFHGIEPSNTVSLAKLQNFEVKIEKSLKNLAY